MHAAILNNRETNIACMHEVQCAADIRSALFQCGQFQIGCIPDDADLKLFMLYPNS